MEGKKMIHLPVDPDLLKSQESHEDQCTVIARVRKFSSLSIHNTYDTRVEHIDYDVKRDSSHSFPVTVYPNGCNSSTKGSVSIEIHPHSCSKPKLDMRSAAIELTCSVAVLDAEGGRRFPQSFVFLSDFYRRRNDFVVDNYLSRDTLLRNPSELLPKGTLTLQVDIVLKASDRFKDIFTSCFKFLKTNFKSEEGPDGWTHYLRLESVLAELLREQSRYFERMLETPMVEKISGYMKIPREEYRCFINIGMMLMGADIDLEVFYNILSALETYSVAQKYGIVKAIVGCRLWLKLAIHLLKVSDISALAELYDDDALREIVDDFLRKENVVRLGAKGTTEVAGPTDKDIRGRHSEVDPPLRYRVTDEGMDRYIDTVEEVDSEKERELYNFYF